MPPVSQVHREVDVPAQRAAPGGMETADGGDIARHRPDSQVLVSAGASLLGDPADEQAADAPIPCRRRDDDRLDLAARPRSSSPVRPKSQPSDPATHDRSRSAVARYSSKAAPG